MARLYRWWIIFDSGGILPVRRRASPRGSSALRSVRMSHSEDDPEAASMLDNSEHHVDPVEESNAEALRTARTDGGKPLAASSRARVLAENRERH